MLDERLNDRLEGYHPPADRGDLVAVADNAVAAMDGLLALQHTVLDLADFAGATPNFGHRALALLLAEGALRTLLLWNWDTCVERSAPEGERIEVAHSREDMERIHVPSVAKIHGCATRVETLLITSEQLEEPPLWTDEAFLAVLRSATAIFIGIGDVADYAKKRIRQLTEGVPEMDPYLVSPRINEDWDGSAWAELLPTLDEGKRIPRTADELLDQLARAWAVTLLDEVSRLTTDLTGVHAAGIMTVLEAIRGLCGPDFIEALRTGAFHERFGESVLSSTESQQAIIALGVIAGEEGADARLLTDGRCRIGETYYELLILQESARATGVRAEAQRRAERLSGRGLIEESAVFLVAGTVIGGLEDDAAIDVLEGPVDDTDVLMGPRGVEIRLLPAGHFVGRAA